MPRQYIPKVECICQKCGTHFWVQPNQTKRGRGKFCTSTCQLAAQHAERHERILSEFWSRVSRVDDAKSCWEWRANTTESGYGLFLHQRAHRHAFGLAYGAIPTGMLVCHTCDNPLCVRNDDEGWYEVNGVLHPRRGHLWLGTNADNMADKEAKGRGVSPRGEASGRARLTWDIVRAIRAEYDGSKSASALGREYGVSYETMRVMLLGLTWKESP